MTISELLLPEFDKEMTSTRKILERVPDDKLDYKPHEKSMALGRLASHVAEMALWGDHTLTLDKLELTPENKPFIGTSRAEILDHLDRYAKSAREALVRTSDADFQRGWSLIWNGHAVISGSKYEVLRGVVFNHMIHHRAQLGVYLRLNGIPIPGVYGSSADDPKTF
jgi:uncharacterized damage-inducible protein DinB